jgi:DNA-directed RNA polymerase subunit RPC12/RpoP
LNEDESMEESTHGLNCPNCGGVVPIPEGRVIVQCPYCDLRSFVRGERGLLRYQAPLRIQRDDAINAMSKFFGSNWAIA